MKRGIIYNNDYSIIIPNDEIWMTSWEIADLFYVTTVSINHAIKRILKKEVLSANVIIGAIARQMVLHHELDAFNGYLVTVRREITIKTDTFTEK